MSTKINAIFLILTIMPFFLCSSQKENLLQLLEKIPESRNILNAIHLQVKLRGKDLDRGHILQVLKTASANADRLFAEESKEMDHEHDECIADLKAFQTKVEDNAKWEFTINRHVSQNNRARTHVQGFIDRVLEEQNDYKAVSNIINDMWHRWQSAQNSTVVELEKVVGLLNKARGQIRRLHSNSSAFLQMDENNLYFTQLNEIRVNFETTFVELQGFRPIITKLLQLMGNTQAINKEEVRVKLLGLLKKIRGEIWNIRDEVEAHRANLNAVFHAVLESYKENLARISKLVARLNKEKQEVQKEALDLSVSSKDAVAISNLSKEIYHARNSQCEDYFITMTKLGAAIRRTKDIIAQISVQLEERFGQLKSYFLQRDISLIEMKKK